MKTTDAFTYPIDTDSGAEDLVGYDVEAEDAHIGTVDEASSEAGNAYIIVDTGFWIFGKKRMIPASRIRQVNHDSQKVFVTLAKDQVQEAPDYDGTVQMDPAYRESLVKHYTAIYR